jgi:hypothetical protein
VKRRRLTRNKLVVGHAQSAQELGAGVDEQVLLGALDPAKRGRAVHLVQRADLHGAEPVHEDVAQDVPLAGRQPLDGVAQSRLELGPVDPLHELDLGIARRGHEREDGVIHRHLVPLAQDVERRAHRDHGGA